MTSTVLLFLLLPTVTIAATECINLATPAFDFPFDDHLIKIFRSANSSHDPVYYYPPIGALLANATELTQNRVTGEYYVTVRIKLWDDDYILQIKRFIKAETNKEKPTVTAIPFKWMHIRYSVQPGPWEELRTEWQSIDKLPQTIPFRIACGSLDQCERVKDVIHGNESSFAFTANLFFAYRLPSYPRKATLTIGSSHLKDSTIFQIIRSQLPPHNGSVFLSKEDYHSLLHETLHNSLSGNLDTDEFIGEGQINSLILKMLPTFSENSTSSSEFTASMWQATYWHDRDQRPDQKLQHLNELFSDGNKWFQKFMRGDNITAELGNSHRSRSLLSALAELKSPSSSVQWDGDKLIITPIPMFRLDLASLEHRETFRKHTVRISKSHSDYVAGVYTDGGPLVTSLQYQFAALEAKLPELKSWVTTKLSELGSRVDDRVPPIGSIQAFAVEGTVQTCWLQCSGQAFNASAYPQLARILPAHRTPDLQSRFLLGFQSGIYSVGQRGGEKEHTLTISEMPYHTHGFSGSHYILNYAGSGVSLGSGNTYKADNSITTGSTGGSNPHNNMPPYHTVVFFIRAC